MDRVIMRWNLQEGYSAMEFYSFWGITAFSAPKSGGGHWYFLGATFSKSKLTQYKGFKGF